MSRVSVVVPIFNGSAYLPSFFASLEAALPQGSEVILIDDGSTEPIWETVPELNGAERKVRLQNERNSGYAVSVNRGFAAATREIVVVLNTDLVLQPRCIESIIDLIGREEKVGIVGSKLVYPTTGLVQHLGMAFGNNTKPHFYLDLPAAHPLAERTREVQVSTGAIAALTRRVLERVGSLDESYYNCNEDIDHCLRAGKLGFRNFVCGDSVAHHWESKSGYTRLSQVPVAEATFWSRWGSSYEVDLGRFVDEALDYILDRFPHLDGMPFHILDLSRGPDQPILLDQLARRWPGIDSRVRHFRQRNNPSDRLWLPLLLPHWMSDEPVPFVYLVDGYRELEENELWFHNRGIVVDDELVLDLTGVALHTSELPRRNDYWASGSAEVAQ